ncbi:heat shock [Trichoderma cornu-damae]|uniref:Heat shock n=1 Tax=Trichoderma cornu-damae TaxID=654480 RepID=A0A9P8QPY0_9HYPO|nr:heat shock [Trichoderma cornu-damae]
MTSQRDYYADLELPPTAGIVEIKRQFRKLALKYHPDRNPGREQEVNSQFQIIQAAHEILSDADAKAKYDATFSRSAASRYPAASGVRGNPWQNVSQQFPVPPQRNSQQTPTSGAQRWNERFSAGVPPTARQHASAATAARAFESMRKGFTKSDRAPPPPPPPRTEGAKMRAEASFGAKKTGYYPWSNAPGDEPPVASNNYSFRVNTQRPEPVPDPLAPFRQKSRREESFVDPRQSFPYATSGGEKTNPFDSVPLNRANSARAPSHKEEPSAPADPSAPKRSSSKMPQKESGDGVNGDGARRGRDGTGADGRPRAVPVPPSHRPSVPPKARTEATPSATAAAPAAPNGNPSTAAQQTANPSATGASTQPPSNHKPFTKPTTPVNETGGPSMYATPQKDEFFSSPSPPHHIKKPIGISRMTTHQNRNVAEVGSQDEKCVPSGTLHAPEEMSFFEQIQFYLLDHLMNNRAENDFMTPDESRHSTTSNHNPPAVKLSANDVSTNSFSFNLDDDTFGPDPAATARFTKNSHADQIDTNFVQDEASYATWQFSAGSRDHDSLPQSRTRFANKPGRRSPIKRRPVPNAEVPDLGAQATQNPTSFDAEGWSAKFGPQTFAPQPVAPNMSGSPTRPSRANARKARTTKPMAGNAATVEEGNSEDDAYDWRGRKFHQKAATVDSPQAMDIDPPLAAFPGVTPIPTPPPLVPTAPTAAPAPASQPQHQPQPPPATARNIPLEPSRPEWRPGNVTGLGRQVYEQAGERKGIPVNFTGSEDSEEFRVSFEDLKNVAPFAPLKAGLKSLDDLKDSLPFESQASAKIHVNVPHAHPLVFPKPPIAPTLPSTIAIDGLKPSATSWIRYLGEFEAYLVCWDAFNSQVVEHFTTRKSNVSRARALKGYSFLGTRSDMDAQEYLNWVEQDNGVRRRWQNACEEHEARLREFMAFRVKMK